jgi:hypothetical protein
MQTTFFAVVLAFATLAACGGNDPSPSGASNACTLTFVRTIDDAHLQVAIERALQRQDPCGLDTTMRTSDLRNPSPFELVRVERDEESVRAVFEARPETRSANPAG